MCGPSQSPVRHFVTIRPTNSIDPLMNVVVVESPGKVKTINKYLGPGYRVLASFGHVRDLSPKDGSVKPDEDFAMTWEVDARGQKRIKEIADALKGADDSTTLQSGDIVVTDQNAKALSQAAQPGGKQSGKGSAAPANVAPANPAPPSAPAAGSGTTKSGIRVVGPPFVSGQ